MLPQSPANQTMQQRWWKCLSDPSTKKKGREDFIHTLTQIGLSPKQAARETEYIFEKLVDHTRPLADIEQEIFAHFGKTQVGNQPMLNVLDSKMTGRAEKIFEQIQEHVQSVTGDVLDFGCGDAQVTQMIADSLKRQGHTGRVVGADVLDYRADHTKALPFSHINTKSEVVTDSGPYELAILTNVMHHEANNENILKQLDKIVSDRLVIIETVPIARMRRK